VAAPVQRNRRTENAELKAGEVPADWIEAKRRQKDVEASWTQKNGVTTTVQEPRERRPRA
jgi:transposase, IS5 family